MRVACAALLLPLLVFAVMGTSFADMRCRMGGMAFSSCCCPEPNDAQGAAEIAADQAEVSAPDCCAIESRELAKAPTDLSRATSFGFHALCVAHLPVPAVLAPVQAQPVLLDPFRARPAGRAILLRKRVFLI